MNWKNVKIYLIILLVAANVVFAVSYISSMSQSTHIDSQAIADTVEFLNKNNVSISSSVIPDRIFNTNIIECPISESYYEDVAEKIRKCSKESINIMPDDSIRILMTDGSVFVFDSKFSVSFDAAPVLQLTDSMAFDLNSDMNFSFAEVPLTDEQNDELLSFIYPDKAMTPKEFSYKLLSSYSDINGYIVAEVSQTLCETEINNNIITIEFDKNKIISLEGTWFYPSSSQEYSSRLYDQLSVLIKDVQNSYSELDEITDEKLYSVNSLNYIYCSYWGTDRRNIYFIPAWKITADQNKIRIYNAVNCELYE